MVRMTALVACAALSFMASPSAQAAPSRFTACLTAGGSLVGVALGNRPRAACRLGDTQVSWNLAGEAGPQGPRGPEGPRGEPGSPAPEGIAPPWTGGQPMVFLPGFSQAHDLECPPGMYPLSYGFYTQGEEVTSEVTLASAWISISPLNNALGYTLDFHNDSDRPIEGGATVTCVTVRAQ